MFSLTISQQEIVIPEDKKIVVAKALQQAFGVSEFEEIRPLTAGLSTALIFRIVIHGKPYLLRVITRTDAISEPTYWFDSMIAAAEIGIAPHVWYTSTEDRIAITDFIEAKPFPPAEARAKLPLLLKRLHDLPGFPKRINYFDFINIIIKKFRSAGILPENMTSELFRLYERLDNIYPRDPNDLVGCHNDLKPENILYDGDRAWLIDWESAFLNDRYFDLAIVANFVVMNDVEEKEYLKIYFREDITEYQLARFFLMRQMLHMGAFTFFMTLLPAEGKSFDWDLPRPEFRDFNDRMWAGGIDLKNVDAKQQYAWVHMEQLRKNMVSERFEASLKIVASQNILI